MRKCSFKVQRVDFARNALEAANNFDDAAVSQADTKAVGSFDNRWLQADREPNAPDRAGSHKGHPRVQTADELERKQVRSNAPTPNPQIFKDSLAAKNVVPMGEDATQPQAPREQRAELGDVARQYRQQLSKTVREDRDEEGKLDVVSSGGSTAIAGGEPVPGRSVAFPVRGAAFHFTTPRGDQTITARAISRGLIERAVRLALLLVAIAIISFGLWMLSRPVTVAILGRRFANLIIILGMISLLGGIIPGVGVLAIITGWMIRCRTQPMPQAAG